VAFDSLHRLGLSLLASPGSSAIGALHHACRDVHCVDDFANRKSIGLARDPSITFIEHL
jgi:hypothetical protein